MKTLSIIAIAGIAAAASADNALYAAPGTSQINSNQGMGLTSGTYDYNFSQTAHWDLSGDSDNVIVTLDLNALLGGVSGADAFVTGIGWNVSVEAQGASWLSEAGYNFNNEIFLSPGAGDDFPGAASYSSPIVNFADIPLADITAAGGIFTIEFFEGFDDVADAIDSFSSGTLTLAVNYQAIPAPAGLAALGLGGLVATRRRR